MDNDVEGPRSGLANFLATYNNLTKTEKKQALRYMINGQSNVPTGPPNNSEPSTDVLVSETNDAHSCHICRELRIGKSDNGDDIFGKYWQFESKKLLLPKDLLTRPSSTQCLLVQWTFGFLAQSLVKFRNDVSQRGVLPPTAQNSSPDKLGRSADLLDFVSSDGATIKLLVERFPDGKTTVNFGYEVDPHLLDKLWDASNHYADDLSYEDFMNKYTGAVSVAVRVYTIPNDPISIPSTIPSRPTLRMKNPDAALVTALEWIKTCEVQHIQCSKKPGVLPTRVIDIGTRFPIRSVRLRWSEEGEEARYTALSYCWGGIQPLITTHATAQDNTDGIVFSKLPKTLQDAINVTSRLGMRYIWIDALCIIQDDFEDITREIASMGQTFQEAFVTISAASATSVHEGFLYGQQSARELALRLPFYEEGVQSGSLLFERELGVYNHGDDPINLRAWTLQEHILARRMLVFGADELWWTCEGATTSQTKGVDGFSHVAAMQRKSDPYRYSLEYWRSIVRDYTCRFLTFPSDKLPAIAGVAAQYGQIFGCKYVAGLWESGLRSELMWCSTRSDISRPLVQRAPSWSWASVDGEIHHKWCPFDVGGDAPRIITCYVSPVSPASPYGAVDPIRSILKMSGDIARVCWRKNRQYIYHYRPRWANYSESDEENFRSGADKNIGRTQADALEDLPEENGQTVVWVFPILKNPIRGLLLFHLGDDRFRRIGLVLRLWQDNEMAQHFETRTITIH